MKFALVTDTHYGFNHKTHRIHEKFLKKLNEECIEAGVDALIHCGDWISNNQHQLPRTWKMFREALGDLPILSVRGNHCLWNYETFHYSQIKKIRKKEVDVSSLHQMYDLHDQWAEEHNIWLLQRHPYEFKDVVVYGFDGWYANASISNDHKFMPKMVESCPTGVWLGKQAHDELDTLIEMAKWESKKKILVSHFAPHDDRLGENMIAEMNANPNWLPFISENFNVFCFGHTHLPVDTMIDKCRFINAGTVYEKNYGYNNPRFQIFEI